MAGLVLVGNAQLWAQVRVEAVPGVPFGVGRIIVPVDQPISSEQLDMRHTSINDDEGRILYPAIRYTEPIGLLREVLGVAGELIPNQVHYHFLFTGSDPLQVHLNLPTPRTVQVVPNGRPIAYRRLLRAWWVRYKAAARKQRQEGAYTPLVETYLTSMLAKRLGLQDLSANEPYESGESLSMLLGTEDYRLATLRRATRDGGPRDQPLAHTLPDPIPWPRPPVPNVDLGAAQIEPIANYVPHECFYIRFAQFPNYLWLRRLLEEYGGDLSRMVLLRGTDELLNQRVENQLGLKESSLSRVLGPQVISDVALIGRDTFLREGAAIGILFEAKNELLKTELQGQRSRRVSELKDEGATMEFIEIEGVKVSFASTPDNRLRSFYATSDRYHLVTNCRTILERFLACGRGEPSLGTSDEFRYARTLMPLEEENTLFVFLSRKFFEGILSPHYQIELSRRLQVLADFELFELATRAAAAEGIQEPTMEQLVRRGLISAPLDKRVDGSEFIVTDGRRIDSRRGARGAFLPVPDTPIEGVTRTEIERFERVADFHRRRWKQIDPVLIALRRTALDKDTERVEIDGRMLPLNKEQYGLVLDFFGPPSSVRIRPPEKDIVSVQAFVDGGSLAIPPHHLYFGIRDAAPDIKYRERGFIKSLQILRTAPAYLAAWPRPGVLEQFGLGGRPVGNGLRKLPLGLFQLYTQDDFSLLSFQPRILTEAAPELAAERVDTAAQLRVQVGDVKNSQFGKWANDLDFQRAWETSVGNVHLLHLIAQQLHVAMPDAIDVAETILDAKLVCPLGGEYQLYENADGTTRWASSAWVDGKQAARQQYVSPLMNWLRGFEAEITIEDDRIVARGTLDIQRAKQEEGGIKLPLFNLLQGK